MIQDEVFIKCYFWSNRTYFLLFWRQNIFFKQSINLNVCMSSCIKRQVTSLNDQPPVNSKGDSGRLLCPTSHPHCKMRIVTVTGQNYEGIFEYCTINKVFLFNNVKFWSRRKSSNFFPSALVLPSIKCQKTQVNICHCCFKYSFVVLS